MKKWQSVLAAEGTEDKRKFNDASDTDIYLLIEDRFGHPIRIFIRQIERPLQSLAKNDFGRVLI
ncbi:MAG: hypothetical protein ABIK61_02660 [candidate division WOR-3 bacterium]